MSNIKLFYENYIANENNLGMISFIFDMVLVCLLCIIFLVILYRFTKERKVFLASIFYLICIIISFILGLKYFSIVIWVSIPVVLICYINYHTISIKHDVRPVVNKQNRHYISDGIKKTELISTIVRAVTHFSDNKIGAIITIERENDLSSFVQQGVIIDAECCYELLETIFHVNTALHDGAVIIRGNRILCAAAFFRPTEKGDLPQHLGARHRAAQGISEDSDAFSIVVSEESGKISTSINGHLTEDIDVDHLTQDLNEHILIKAS